MSQKPEITFKYIYNYNYNPTYVNGAQGGVSPRGEIVVHFYHERPPLPNAITHEITPQGGIGRETAVEPENLASSMVRFIDTGVVMNYDNARLFHTWLGDRLSELENMHRTQQAFETVQKGPQA